jgi:hypothetical protein
VHCIIPICFGYIGMSRVETVKKNAKTFIGFKDKISVERGQQLMNLLFRLAESE